MSKIRLSAERGRNLDVHILELAAERASSLSNSKLASIGITTFSSFPLHLVTFAGIIFFIFAIGLGIQTLYLKFTGQAFNGFTTVILLELIIASLLMISLGIIGEYLARIYEEVKGRPRYIVAESIDLADGARPANHG